MLLYGREQKKLANLSKPMLAESEKALKTWGEYLLGQRPNPGQYENHAVIFNVIANFTGKKFASNIHRYLLNAIDVEIPSNNEQAFVYVKLPYILHVGFINVKHPEHWKGTKLHIHNGILCSRRCIIPGEIGNYLNSRAEEIKEKMNSISEKQKEVIHKSFEKNLDRVATSNTFKAMNIDFELFGGDIFE